MSLINCPECGNECSSSALSCPQCGFAFVTPVAKPKVIVQEVPREDSFPKWIFIPLALLGVLALVVLFMVLRSNDADKSNINVNIATSRQPERVNTTTVPSTTQPSTVTVPSTSQPSTITVPQSVEPPPTTVTSVPSSSSSSTVTVPAPTDKGSVVMQAKILSKTGSTQPARSVKLYLLDRDLDSILSEASIEDETGQGVVNAFALSVVDPNKYREINQKAYAAIKRHIVYSTTTDASGKAQLPDVKPKNYYLFGITATKNGFAIWNAPVFINNGQNALDLQPVSMTEVINDNQ
jgi:hypothetical protein